MKKHKRNYTSTWHYLVHQLKRLGNSTKIPNVTEGYDYLINDELILYYKGTDNGTIIVMMGYVNHSGRSAVYELTFNQFKEFKTRFRDSL